MPGGRFVIAAVAGLLKVRSNGNGSGHDYSLTNDRQAVGTVSETYDAIERILQKIKTTLESYESLLDPASPLSDTLSERLVKTLVMILDFLSTVTAYCNDELSEGKRRRVAFKQRISQSVTLCSTASEADSTKRTSGRQL